MDKFFICILLIPAYTLTISCNSKSKIKSNTPATIQIRPTISFSFDDGSINDFGEYSLESWNQLLLDNLKKHNLKSILFSTGNNKTTQRGKYVLTSWNEAGHLICNHTLSHPNFNNEHVSLENFESELMQNDSIIKTYSNYLPLFRFPYLKEGDTKEKIEGFRSFMKQKGYKNGHVTIDASDWYINSRLIDRLKENPNADISGIRDYYMNHLLNRALYYDSIAFQLTGRRIKHVILLHHNLAAALFLDDLINHFIDHGWNIMDTDKAYEDKIYSEVTHTIPAGESLIWALAKQSGKFEKALRYPAEDGEYEKALMDMLKL